MTDFSKPRQTFPNTAELIGPDVVEIVIITVQQQDGNFSRFQKIQQFQILITG